MQYIQKLLQPMKDAFFQRFSQTFQLLLDNYLGDYLEDPSQLQLTTLITGVHQLQLNKAFLNNLLGFGTIQLDSAYIEYLRVNNMKLEAKGIHFIFHLVDQIDYEALIKHLDEILDIQARESEKLDQLKNLREEIIKRSELEASQDFSKQTPDNGILYFFKLAETLFSNSSLHLQDINILLKWENGKSLAFRILETKIDFQRPEQNQKLFLKCNIQKIELKLNNSIIGKLENALNLSSFLELKDKKIVPKVEGSLSTIHLVVDQIQLKDITVILQKYLQLSGQLNTFICNRNQEDKFELPEDISQSINNQKQSIQQSVKMTFFPKYIDFEKSIVNSTQQHKQETNIVDLINNNINEELNANQPIEHSIFASCSFDTQNDYFQLQNQQETIKLQIYGLKFAIHDNSEPDSQFFPEIGGKYFTELDDHYFIEVRKIDIKVKQPQVFLDVSQISVSKMICHDFGFNSVQQGQEIFQSCNQNQKSICKEFSVIPLLMMGKGDRLKEKIGNVIFNYDHLQEECQQNFAIKLTIKIYNGQYQDYCQITAQFSDVIAQITQEQITQLLAYIPKSELQPEVEPTMSYVGFEVKFPYINLNYSIQNRPFSFKMKNLQLSQKPTQKFSTKQAILTPFEELPEGENPLSFLIVSFYSIWVSFQGDLICSMGQGIQTDKQIFPLIMISTQKKLAGTPVNQGDLEEFIPYWKLKSEMLIRGQIPLVEINLTEKLMLFILSIVNEQQQPQQLQEQQQQMKPQIYTQVIIDKINIKISDEKQQELIQMELQKLSFINFAYPIIIIQGITCIDLNFKPPLFNKKQVQQNLDQYNAGNIMIYNTESMQANTKLFVGKKNYSHPLTKVDTKNYVVKIALKPNCSTIQLKNLCIRICDFSFQSILYLKQLADNTLKMEQKQQQSSMKNNNPKFEIGVSNVYLDLLPYYKINSFIKNKLESQLIYSQNRSLIQLKFTISNDIFELIELNCFIAKITGLEIQCPILLINHFDQLESFQFFKVLNILGAQFKDNLLIAHSIEIDLKYDVIQALLEHIGQILEIVELPTSEEINASSQILSLSDYLKHPIQQNSILANSIQNYVIKLLYTTIKIEAGQTYHQLPISFDDDEFPSNFQEEVEQFVKSRNTTKNKNDDITIQILETLMKIEILNGATALQLETDIKIIDNISKSKFALIMASEQQQFLRMALILEKETLTMSMKLWPLRICVSGALLEFLMDMQKTDLQIQKPYFEDEIMLIPEKLPNQMFHIKNLNIQGTQFNLTYDSDGINLNGMLKMLLQISSFKNLVLTMNEIQLQKYGDMNVVSQCIAEKIVEAFGSQTILAFHTLNSMQIISIITSLTSGLRNLIVKPFQEGLVLGTLHGVSDLSRAITYTLLKTMTVPSTALVKMGDKIGLGKITGSLSFLNNQSRKLQEQLSPSDEIPKQFLKKYNQ